MILRNKLLLATALGALGASAAAQTPESRAPANPAPAAAARSSVVEPVGLARATALVGVKVTEGTDNTAGEIKDLIACDTGDLVVLIERHADGKLVAAPLSVLTANFDGTDKRTVGDTAKVDTFVIGSGYELADAPLVADRNQLDKAWWTAYGEHYGRKPMAKAEPASPNRDPAAKPVASEASTARHDAVCLATLIGQDVKTATGDVLGDINDIAVNLGDGKVAYVVISTGRVLGVGGSLHGVRMDSLTPDATRKFVTLQTDKATFERTTGIDIDKLPAKASFEVGMTTPAGTDRGATASGSPR
jgi:sporulation protein YlmC with PRC-barrel domain